MKNFLISFSLLLRENYKPENNIAVGTDDLNLSDKIRNIEFLFLCSTTCIVTYFQILHICETADRS